MIKLDVIENYRTTLLAGAESTVYKVRQDGERIYIRGSIYFEGAGKLTITQKDIWGHSIKTDTTSIAGAGSIYFNLLIYAYEVNITLKNESPNAYVVYYYITTE